MGHFPILFRLLGMCPRYAWFLQGLKFAPPNVDSIVIQIDPFVTPKFHPCGIEHFDLLNRALFAQPRKALRNS